ncbi:unnamed protein product [Moneuplotes crassus]|uniref:Uncharacterized protein n=1 Tax=Euplotes crassus TaxID=5936 RepID=A0AAD1XIN9_EUPCR|nr:unnamed protein product [Moneuplotes crassus]
MGLIFTTAWLTHIVSSKDFYHTKANSQEANYFGFMIFLILTYFLSWFPYLIHETIVVATKTY